MVVDAVLAANRSTPNESDAAFQERVQRMETIWNTDAALPFARTILDAPASRFFRDQIAEDRRFLRTILTGKAGTVIGASHKTLDYYQADEDPWRAAYAEGRGAVYISEIRFDAVTKHNYVYIAVPVVQANSTEPIGVLEVLIDVAGLLPAIPRNTGDTAFRRYLVASDGTVISGPDGELFSMKVQSPELAAVREQVPNLAGASGFVLTEIQGRGEELIGYADTGLGAEYKLLDTHVLVAQEASSALASVNKLILLVWILALSAIALLTLGVAYFSLHRKVKFEDIGQALQPESSKPTA
jgi:hypothetical protein